MKRRTAWEIKMKKLFYYTTKDMTDSEVGINNKIREQIDFFRKSGFSVDAVYRRNVTELVVNRKNRTQEREDVLKTLRMRPYKIFANTLVRKYIEKNEYDCAYIRYVYCDMEFMKLLKALRKRCRCIVIEIPTFPYDAELVDNTEHRILLQLDRLHRNGMKKYADRVVTFSPDSEIFGIPAIRTMNGLNFDHVGISERNDNYRDKINLIAVASHARWHGYDRILAGMADYCKKGGERDFLFHIVGEGPELDNYRQMVQDNKLQDHVIFYGTRKGEELDEIYNNCDIAAASFGFHRIGLTLASNLKSREYAAKGLPVISGVDIDIFKGPLSEYFCLVPYDDSPVDMEEVASFYDRIYGDKSHESVSKTIRSIASSECSLDAVMQPVLDVF